MNTIFSELGIILILATFFAYLSYILRQPLMLSYIVAGIIIGPSGLKLVTNTQIITTLSEIGILFFLFIIGLEISLPKLRQYGKPAIIAGISQIAATFIVGFLFLISFFSAQEAIYLSLALVFSSTLVVVKLLSEKSELDTIHGRIILGILILQDIFAIVIVGLMQSTSIYAAIFYILALFVLTILIAIFIVPPLFKFAARSNELLFISSITWCFLGALGGSFLGFSTAIGGFLAGLSLANCEERHQIISKMQPLRDFFSILFFAALGMQLTFVLTKMNILTAGFLLFWVLVGQTIIVAIILMLMQFHKKVAFLCAINVAQTSEFSLIFAAQAFLFGKISANTVSLIAFVTATSIILSSYMIKYDESLYKRFKNIFSFIRIKEPPLSVLEKNNSFEAILVGHDRMGFQILKKLHDLKKRSLVVEMNPDIVKKLHKENVPCIYGDISDDELLSQINWQTVRYVLCTSPSKEDNISIVRKIKQENNMTLVFCRAHTIEDALEMYANGADYVIIPHLLGGERIAEMLDQISIAKVTEYRVKHMGELHARKR